MLMLAAKRLPRGLLLTVPNPSTSTVRAYCPAFKGANAAEMVRLAFVTAKRRGLFVPLAALPHNAKALPGCGMAVRRATVPYGNNGAFGCNRMEPPPDAIAANSVPNTASTHLSRDINTMLVSPVPLAAPSHCIKPQPGLGIAAIVTNVLLR